MPLVVLRPPVYLDDLFSPWNGPDLVSDGVLACPLPEAPPAAWPSHGDLAEAAYAALTRDGLTDRTFDIEVLLTRAASEIEDLPEPEPRTGTGGNRPRPTRTGPVSCPGRVLAGSATP